MSIFAAPAGGIRYKVLRYDWKYHRVGYAGVLRILLLCVPYHMCSGRWDYMALAKEQKGKLKVMYHA